MYTVGIEFDDETDNKEFNTSVNFSLEKNPDGTVGKIPEDDESSYRKIVNKFLMIQHEMPSLKKITFTMDE